MLENKNLVSFREMCPEVGGTRYSTHGLYPYPAKLIPHIPYYFLSQIRRKSSDSKVLDPFCGTGTVMVEALHNGWNSVGIEINPVTALVAKVKTTTLSIAELEKTYNFLKESCKVEKDKDCALPSFENLGFWFTKRTIIELAKINECIQTIDNDAIRDFFKVTFASIIKDASRADSKIYVPVLPKKGLRKRKPNPWTLFRSNAEANIRSMQEFSGSARAKNFTNPSKRTAGNKP